MVKIKQHQPLRPPEGWEMQEKSLVYQMERLVNDLYKEISIINEKLNKLDERVTALEEE